MPRVAPPLDFKGISERSLPTAVAVLRGYLKFTSMAWIRALRQPILDGLIVKQWSAGVDRALRGFCVRHGCDEVLLRTDALNQRWSRRRGGYLIPVSGVRAAIEELSRENRIAALLEPVSPYLDRYSLAAVTDEARETISVEVVGPGFDASDLLRSDTQAHERFEVLAPRRAQSADGRESIRGRRTYAIANDDYKRTVEQRLVKIGARLRDPAHPEVILESSTLQRASVARDAADFLRRTKQTMLLRHLDEYQPIPRRLLSRFVDGVGKLIDGLGGYDIHLGATSFSGTFTTSGRFVFWDFFPADLGKARMLYLDA